MSDVPLIGPLFAHRIKAEMGVKGERHLSSFVGRIVEACAAQTYGRNLFENVYLTGLCHGATLMERRLDAEREARIAKAGEP